MNYSKLNLTGSSAPHIRTRDSTSHMMASVLIALLPACGFAVYNFGPRPAVNVLVSIAGCCGFELLCRLVRKQDMTVGDLSAAVTGMLVALSSPVVTPYWLLLLGDFFAIAVVKQLPGGLGRNLLNPALSAQALLMLWNGGTPPSVAPHTSAALWGAVDAATAPTPLSLLRANDLAGLRELYSLPEMLVGLTSGAAGEVSALLLITGGLFLVGRKVISWRIPAGFLGAAAVLTFIFAWGNDRTDWMLYELLSGGLMLAAFFMAADPVTSPISPAAQLIYGVGCGFLTVLLRYYGFWEEGVGAAVLFMNLIARPLDEYLLTGRINKPVLPRLSTGKKTTQ